MFTKADRSSKCSRSLLLFIFIIHFVYVLKWKQTTSPRLEFPSGVAVGATTGSFLLSSENQRPTPHDNSPSLFTHPAYISIRRLRCIVTARFKEPMASLFCSLYNCMINISFIMIRYSKKPVFVSLSSGFLLLFTFVVCLMLLFKGSF